MKTAEIVPSFEDVVGKKTWVGGPTHILQMQHIPGYQGHVQNLQSENVYGKTFARTTAECLNERVKQGQQPSIDERFQTIYKSEFNKPNLRNNVEDSEAEKIVRRLKQEEENQKQAIYQAYQRAPKSIDDIPPIDRIPVIGYMGHKPVYRHPIKQVIPPSEPKIQQNPFTQLSQGFQISLLEKDEKLKKKLDQKGLPIQGYTGHQTGVKSENVYGKTFRDTAIISMKLHQYQRQQQHFLFYFIICIFNI